MAAVLIGLFLFIGLLLLSVQLYIRIDSGWNAIDIMLLKMFRFKFRKKGSRNSSVSFLENLSHFHSKARTIDIGNSAVRQTMLQAAVKSWPVIASLLGKTKIKAELQLKFHLSDPYKAAMLHGLMETGTGCLFSLLSSLIKGLDLRYKIVPVFEQQGSEYQVNIVISVRPFHVLVAILRLLPILLRFRKKLKKGSVLNGSPN